MREPVGSSAGGFSFDLCKRNSFLEKKGVSPPGLWKTGTTIAGVIYKASEMSYSCIDFNPSMIRDPRPTFNPPPASNLQSIWTPLPLW